MDRHIGDIALCSRSYSQPSLAVVLPMHEPMHEPIWLRFAMSAFKFGEDPSMDFSDPMEVESDQPFGCCSGFGVRLGKAVLQ